MDMPQTKGSFILSLREARTGASWSAGGSSSPDLSPGSNAGLTSLEAGRVVSWIHMGAAACFCLTHRTDGMLERQVPKQFMHLCCTPLCEGRNRLYQVLFLCLLRLACVWWQSHHSTEFLLSPPRCLLFCEQVSATIWLEAQGIHCT